MQDFTKIKGMVTLVLKDSNGHTKEQRTIPNLVVNAGLAHIASRLASDTPTIMSHMAVGTSATAAGAGDTTLGTEVGRVALSSTNVVTNTVTYTGMFGAGVGTGALVEAGIFNDVTTGTMLCRTTFAVVNKGASDTLEISWTLTLS